MGSASYSPDGKQLLLTGSPEAFGGIGKNCGNHPIANDFDSQAYIMDLTTRHIEPITKDFAPTVYPLQWNKGDGCIYFNTNDEDCRNIYRYSPQTKKFEKLNPETDVTSAFALSEKQPFNRCLYRTEQSQCRSRLSLRYEKEDHVCLPTP